ncbi:hypothetical protein M0802_007615 [Mischocyttarus mexicanus]|nr:hypothetical protein M0802_007615 [Mischocyttarus mexicanus]
MFQGQSLILRHLSKTKSDVTPLRRTYHCKPIVGKVRECVVVGVEKGKRMVEYGSRGLGSISSQQPTAAATAAHFTIHRMTNTLKQ